MTAANNAPRFTRRRALAALAVGVAAPGVLASCVSKPGKQNETSSPPPKPTVTFLPSDAATDVVPTAAIAAEVRDGWFQRISLSNPDGKVVAGTLSQDRTAYTVT
ncbi:MAG: L,D-transpeptidase, partial [Mycobacteriaceae bacterium]|nr:L,D-transpeptidase [Mycobacteriaceae bacterium]